MTARRKGREGGGEGGRFAYAISFVGGRHQAFRPFQASHTTVVLIPCVWWTRASTSSFGITICSCLSSLIFLRLLLLRGELSDRCLDRRAIGSQPRRGAQSAATRAHEIQKPSSMDDHTFPYPTILGPYLDNMITLFRMAA